MQLKRFTDYALRVVMYSAAKGPAQRSTVDEIAERFDISRHHLVKVVHGLHNLGYLDTRRGRGGGFTLSRAPEDICVGELVRRTEGPLALVECFDPATDACRLSPACGLKPALARALEAFFAILDDYTVADLLGDPRSVRRVLDLAHLGGGVDA